ncbi:PspC domain-containing protein [Patescibacteria group bacterium]|nr:PspC domain-containing protein [Patescibacteria group bacterium]
MPQRNLNNKLIFGVCAGLSDYFTIDVTVIRVIFVLGILAGGLSILIYIILALIMPSDISKVKQEPIIENNDKKLKNGAYLLITIGILIILSSFNFFAIIETKIFWGIAFLLYGILIIIKGKNVKFIDIIVTFIILLILATLTKDLLSYLSVRLPYPANTYF